jgi:Chaperone of endosialidase
MGNLVFQAASGGQVAVSGPNTASSFTIAVPAVSGTFVTTGDTGTVSNTMLATGTFSNITGVGTITTGVWNGTTIGAGYGGTGSSSAFTANGVVYASSTSALATGSNLTWDGSLFSTTVADNTIGVKFKATTSNIRFLPQDSGVAKIAALNAAESSFYPLVTQGSSLQYVINTSEIARFTSTGLGIGTSSPSRLLHVQATGTGNVATFQSNAGPNVAFVGTESSGRTYLIGEGIVNNGNFSIYDSTASAERLVIDSSGNAGLGVTPSAWGSGVYQALEMSNGTGIAAYTGTTAPVMVVNSNAYRNSSSGNWTYKVSNAATQYIQNQGVHSWQVASSGTAGTSINGTGNFTQAMTLDNSGRLLVGLTSDPGFSAQVNIYNASNGGLTIGNSTNTTVFSQNSNDFYIDVDRGGSAGNLIFRRSSSNTESMRIDSSGNLLVGTTSAVNGSNSIAYNGATKNGLNINDTSGSSGSNPQRYYFSGSLVGYIAVTSTATTYNSISDQRLKINIVDAPQGNIDDIKVRSFDWKVDGTHQEYGMIAQELLEVAPYAVSVPRNSEEMMGVDYSKLVPMMIKEIQSLKQRIATLENK